LLCACAVEPLFPSLRVNHVAHHASRHQRNNHHLHHAPCYWQHQQRVCFLTWRRLSVCRANALHLVNSLSHPSKPRRPRVPLPSRPEQTRVAHPHGRSGRATFPHTAVTAAREAPSMAVTARRQSPVPQQLRVQHVKHPYGRNSCASITHHGRVSRTGTARPSRPGLPRAEQAHGRVSRA